MTYSSVDGAVAASFLGGGAGAATLDQLLDWGPVFFLVALPAAVALLQSSSGLGLRRSVLAAAALSFAGAAIRCVPAALPPGSVGTWPVHVGQILNAAAAPFVVVSPAYLSLLWFPPAERNAATAAANTANALGRAAGFFLGPALVPQTAPSDASAASLATLVFVELGVAAVPLLAAIAYLPAEPAEPPSRAAADERERRGGPPGGAASLQLGGSDDDEAEARPPGTKPRAGPCARGVLAAAAAPFVAMLRLLAKPRTAAVMLSGGLQMAAYGAWSGVLPGVLTAAVSRGGAGRTPWAAGVVGATNTLAGVAGGLAAGAATGWACLSTRLRASSALLCAGSAAAFGVAALCAPPLSSLPALGGGWPHAAVLVASTTVAGLLRGGSDPLFFELAAESAYPASSGDAGAALTLFYHGLLSAMLALPPAALAAAAFPGMAACAAVSALVLVPVRVDYPRRRMERGPVAAGALGDDDAAGGKRLGGTESSETEGEELR